MLADVRELGQGGGNRCGRRDTVGGQPVVQANHSDKWSVIAELTFEWINGAGHAIAGLRLPGAELAMKGDGYMYHPIARVGWDGIAWGNLGITKATPVFGSLAWATDGAFLTGEDLAESDAIGVDRICGEFGWRGRVWHHAQALKRRGDGLVVGVDSAHPDLVAGLVDHDLHANVGLAGLELDGDFAQAIGDGEAMADDFGLPAIEPKQHGATREGAGVIGEVVLLHQIGVGFVPRIFFECPEGG